jgi:hypothetical protein
MSNELTHLATEVYTPQNLDWSHMGWGLESQPEQEKRYSEAVALEKAMSSNPMAFTQRDPKYLDPEIKAKWDKFQDSKGYDPGSCDLTLIEEFYYGRRFHWLPQKTGSCTVSNAFRMHFRRVLWELLLKGQLETPLGTTEYGSSCAAYYAPVTYGIAREIGGLRNGDGGFCGPTIESMMRGVLRCNNGKLLELLNQLKADGEKDFPEPQNNAVYRAFQAWKYNALFAPFLTDPLLESVKVSNTDTLIKNLEDYKPSIMCSMLAVKKGGTHQGLTFFVADRGNTWAHNMAWGGKIVWKGRTFGLLSNESWQNNLIYPIPIEEIQDVIFPRYRPEVQTMGEVGLQQAVIAA